MKLALNEQMQSIDQIISQKYGLPGTVLMENAGRILAEEMKRSCPNAKKISVLCATGNNGGDGFVAARHLQSMGVEVRIFIVGPPKEMKSDVQIHFQVAKNMGLTIDNVNDTGGIIKLEKILPNQDGIIDALFGTGLSKNVEGVYASVIDVVNRLNVYTLSADLPSGVDGNTGRIMGTAIQADKTVSFILPKIGNILYPGADYGGELVVRNIGTSEACTKELDIKHSLVTRKLVTSLLPCRHKDSHKGTYGRASVVAGSSGMTGAAILTCRAALRSGLGLLKLYIPESLNLLITTNIPEVVTVPLTEMRRGVISISQIEKVIEETHLSRVVAIGPGCGTTGEMGEMVRRIIEDVSCPVVIDADGLNVLAKNVNWLEKKKGEIILTPHPGEMGRLLGISTEEVTKNPIDTARTFSQKFGVIVVLKGSRTLIALPQGDVLVNVTGNTGMATAGSGDVLTGTITGFIAQGISPANAAILSVYVHGHAGDIMAREKGEFGLLAGDIVDGLTQALMELVEEAKFSKRGRLL